MNDFRTYDLTMSVKAMDKAREAFTEVKKEWEKLTEELEALPKVDAVMDGYKRVQEQKEIEQGYSDRKQEAVKKAVEKVKQAEAEYLETLEDQVNPTAEKMKDCIEANMLLMQDFVTDEKQLATLAEEWKDNVVMRIAIRKYADKHEWKGFEFLTKEESMKEFGEIYFKNVAMACGTPVGGYWALWMDTEGTLIDQLRGCDLLEEYRASEG